MALVATSAPHPLSMVALATEKGVRIANCSCTLSQRVSPIGDSDHENGKTDQFEQRDSPFSAAANPRIACLLAAISDRQEK
jgi:hypothetical protein